MLWLEERDTGYSKLEKIFTKTQQKIVFFPQVNFKDYIIQFAVTKNVKKF